MSSPRSPVEVPLNLAAARRWALASRVGLAEARTQIDALNVFPVPDGDTGTNMFLTFDGALDVLRGHHATHGGEISLVQGLALLARGMLLSARGNSGVILSQLARGLHEAAAKAGDAGEAGDTEGGDAEAGGADADAGPGGVIGEVGAQLLAEAFTRADHLAWAGVSSPVEGTILSVSRAAASAAREAAAAGANPAGVSAAALAAARSALEHTQSQLPALRRAGVVDAGGAGLVIVLEALHRVLTDDHAGSDASDSPWFREGAVLPPAGCAGDGDGEGAYEVMYLLSQSDEDRVGHLRAHLEQVGHSVLVVGGPQDWRVHVHLDDPQVAVEAGTMAGQIDQVRIEELVRADASAPTADARPRASVGVVACAGGEGLLELFEQAGATVVRSAAGARASTGQLLNAIWAVPAHSVVVLPNDGDVLMSAQAAAAAAREEGLTVEVVPSRAAVQGLAALAVFDPGATLPETLTTMSEAAGATVHAELTVASRDAQTGAGPCRAGQALGLLDGQIVVIDDDATKAATRLLARLVTDQTELLTVVRGAGADEAARTSMDQVVGAIEAAHPGVEVLWLDGGQPAYPWLLGAE
ncbi:DAK2 domain-containing protein [Ornithinimicrobium ciconiae]|uniref:DAK2 domain-containing protein n=1 Tax=Ornithinimicrobium ciconiae TaxID=2594265 RepID=A0A516GCA9_9MICO|nr:DAK2 domain-containing protein [Ornithinimicrobium ciconiae]QDO89166.1 DAK2 domain-containing protein [Ornithinimicrobium ciconiae]